MRCLWKLPNPVRALPAAHTLRRQEDERKYCSGEVLSLAAEGVWRVRYSDESEQYIRPTQLGFEGKGRRTVGGGKGEKLAWG